MFVVTLGVKNGSVAGVVYIFLAGKIKIHIIFGSI